MSETGSDAAEYAFVNFRLMVHRETVKLCAFCFFDELTDKFVAPPSGALYLIPISCELYTHHQCPAKGSCNILHLSIFRHDRTFKIDFSGCPGPS